MTLAADKLEKNAQELLQNLRVSPGMGKRNDNYYIIRNGYCINTDERRETLIISQNYNVRARKEKFATVETSVQL